MREKNATLMRKIRKLERKKRLMNGEQVSDDEDDEQEAYID